MLSIPFTCRIYFRKHSWVFAFISFINGPLTRYVNLRVAHAPGMPGTFSPPPWISDPDMHRSTCVTHVPWCIPGSLTSAFLWSRWRGNRFRHSRRMRNPQFYASGKMMKYRIKLNNLLVDNNDTFVSYNWPCETNAWCPKWRNSQWAWDSFWWRHKGQWRHNQPTCL